jgi:opacity protein-like surface antigen
MRSAIARIGLCAAISTWMLSSAAGAADLYLTPAVGYVGGFVKGKGQKFNSPVLRFGGKGDDWTPGGALALGIAVPMNEIAPFDVGLPDWNIRFEIETLQTADDLDISFPGIANPVRSSLETTLTNFGLWMDFPVTDGVTAIIGHRVRLFDPVLFLIGGGPGFVRSDVRVRHDTERRSQESLDLAWQAGAGFGLRLTDSVTLTATYRYADLGRVNAKTCCVTPLATDFLRIDPEQHQVYFGARILFLAVSSPNRWYGRW